MFANLENCLGTVKMSDKNLTSHGSLVDIKSDYSKLAIHWSIILISAIDLAEDRIGALCIGSLLNGILYPRTQDNITGSSVILHQ